LIDLLAYGRFTRKWSPVSYRSSARQGKFAGRRPTYVLPLCHATNLRGPICTIIPKFVTIWLNFAEIWRFNVLKIATVYHLGFFKSEFLTDHRVKMSNMRHLVKFRGDRKTISRFWR